MKRAFKIAAMTAALSGFCIGWMVGCTVTTNPPTAPAVGQGGGGVCEHRRPALSAEQVGAAETFYVDTQNNVAAGELFTPAQRP